MPTAYITHASCAKHEMGPYHPECPDRLAAINDRLIAAGLDVYLRHYDAPEATREQLLRVHSAVYLAEIEHASPREGLHYLDPDTALNPHSLDAARHAAGAVVLATDLVMRGECRSAFCAVRPPGHHAERRRAMGFCLYNNVAVGAMHALDHHKLDRVAVIDFDVHHGNGSEDILASDPRVLMASTFQRGLYPFLGEEPKGLNMVNVGLPAGATGEQLRAAVQEYWMPALDAFAPQLLYISAGFDAHQADPLGGMNVTDDGYRRMTQALLEVAQTHAGGRVVSLLEGGYDPEALGGAATTHWKSLAEG